MQRQHNISVTCVTKVEKSAQKPAFCSYQNGYRVMCGKKKKHHHQQQQTLLFKLKSLI